MRDRSLELPGLRVVGREGEGTIDQPGGLLGLAGLQLQVRAGQNGRYMGGIEGVDSIELLGGLLQLPQRLQGVSPQDHELQTPDRLLHGFLRQLVEDPLVFPLVQECLPEGHGNLGSAHTQLQSLRKSVLGGFRLPRGHVSTAQQNVRRNHARVALQRVLRLKDCALGVFALEPLQRILVVAGSFVCPCRTGRTDEQKDNRANQAQGVGHHWAKLELEKFRRRLSS